MDELLRKTPVTTSDLIVEKHGKDVVGISKYVYAECSVCESLSHLIRVSIWSEKECDKKILSIVSFGFPSECYVESVCCKVSTTKLVRFIQKIAEFWRRLKIAWKAIDGGTFYFECSPNLSFSTTREFAKKIIDAIDDVERENAG